MLLPKASVQPVLGVFLKSILFPPSSGKYMEKDTIGLLGRRDVSLVLPNMVHARCQPASRHLVRSSSLVGFPSGSHKVLIIASWCNQWSLAVWRGNYLALRVGGLCLLPPCPGRWDSLDTGGCKQSLLLIFWWEKSDQLLGWCPCQLASGDTREKASSHHGWEIRQASLGSPHSLSA